MFTVVAETDSDITVTGVGLVISPGSDVIVTLECGDTVTTKRVQNTGDGDVVPVYFDKPWHIDSHLYDGATGQLMMRDHWKIEATIKGVGVARVPDTNDERLMTYPERVDEVEVDGRNQQGQKVGKVSFEFKWTSSRVFSELYFYVNSDERPFQPRSVPQPGPAARLAEEVVRLQNVHAAARYYNIGNMW